jgi:transcriptional regulator with XRE-family HTH domain
MLGLSRADFAYLVNSSERIVSNTELGSQRLTPQLAAALARKFNISPDWLLDGAGPLPNLPPIASMVNVTKARQAALDHAYLEWLDAGAGQ